MSHRVSGSRFWLGSGQSRRSFLQAGFLGLTSLSLSSWLRLQGRAADSGPSARNTAVIFFWLDGGLSHLDSYDLKPSAPAEYRGPMTATRTKVAGIDICDLMPGQARLMDKLAIIRTLTHGAGAHEEGSHWVLTGHYATQPRSLDAKNPSAGAVTARARGANRPGLPPYVAVPAARSAGHSPGYHGSAYLGTAYQPFQTGGDPNNSDFVVRNLTLPDGLTVNQLQDRRRLLAAFDDLRRDLDHSGAMTGLDRFQQEAFETMTSQAARQAFDLGRESEGVRERYGRHTWGQSALLARRLVEAGVTFVTVHLGGWDHHSRIEPRLRDYLPRYDQVLSALVEDLNARGLYDRVLVCATGEFGRTPLINRDAGRDHWPGAGALVLGGGGLRTGQVIGATSVKGEFVRSRPVDPGDLLATVYHVLGIDPRQVFLDNTGRPHPILTRGQAIAELI